MTAMSGSFDDRPPVRRAPPPPAPIAGYETFDDGYEAQPPVAAGRPASPYQALPGDAEYATAAATQQGRPAQRQTTRERLQAEARLAAGEPGAKHAAIVPAGSVTGRSLWVVISIMCFLACLTCGAVYMINASADAWLKDMASEVTVQVESKAGAAAADTDKTVSEVAAFLTKEPGITSVKPLTLDDSAALLEPWLGQTDALKSLPVPRLVAIEIDRGSPPDLERLRKELSTRFSGTTLDDHRHWQRQIRTVTRSFALGGLLILLLVAAATIAIIESATRSAMASHRDIVEVLHFVGATDRFIAREFETHFLKLGIKAGLVGALAACFVFLVAPFTVDLIGGQSVTAAELRQLVGSGALELPGYGLLALVVVIIAGLCMLTSRLGVFRILNSHV